MRPETDKEGFLRSLEDWNEAVADELAAADQITLTDEHWEVIRLVRQYYADYRVFPANRILVSRMKDALGASKGSSIYLMSLFTGKPAKVIARISGLPKPPNCD